MRRNNLFDEHTLDIVKAAMPHVHPRAQGGMNVLLKANDLMSTIEHGGNDGEVSAMDMEHWTPDPEEMLLSVKEVANPGEVEIVDMILNFFKARKLYSAYQTYSETVLEAQGLGGNGNGGFRRNPFNPFSLFGMGPNMNSNMNQRNQNQNGKNAGNVKNANVAGNTGNNQNAAGQRGNGMGPNNGQMPNFFNFMMSQMSPEQKQTFDMLNMMMNNMPNTPGNVSGQNVKKPANGKVKNQSLSEEESEDDNSSES